MVDAFNEDALTTIINTLHEKMRRNGEQRQTLRDLLVDATSIKLVSEPDPTVDDINQIKLVLPLDPKLKVTITPERRKAICDIVINETNLL